MIDFHPTSNIKENTNVYVNRYILESKYFMYQRFFSKKKNRLKITTRSTTYVYDKVRKDYFVNLRYGQKTFFCLNTGIIGALTKELKKFPIISTSLYQIRFKELTIYQKHLLFRSHQDFRYRNITLKLKPFQKHFYLLSSRLLTKPLNKYLFFNLHNNLKFFNFNMPVLLLQKSWKSNKIVSFFLGFKFLINNIRNILKTQKQQKKKKKKINVKKISSKTRKFLIKVKRKKKKHSFKIKMKFLRNLILEKNILKKKKLTNIIYNKIKKIKLKKRQFSIKKKRRILIAKKYKEVGNFPIKKQIKIRKISNRKRRFIKRYKKNKELKKIIKILVSKSNIIKKNLKNF